MNDESVIKDPETGQITAIKINVPPYDPELDPDSPDFNPAKFKEAIGNWQEKLRERLDGVKGSMVKYFLSAIESGLIVEAIEAAETQETGEGGEDEYIEAPEPKELEGQFIMNAYAFRSIIPDKHTMINNRLANELQKGRLADGEGFDLVVANKGKSNEITAYTMISYEAEDGISFKGHPYTEYDRQVHDAVVSQWLYGSQHHIITPESIYRTMTHKTQSETPSPQQIGAVTRSLEKMRRIHVFVDATEEMQRRKFVNSNDGQFRFNDYLLNLRGLDRGNVKSTLAYEILSEPILLHYASKTQQFITVKAELLDVKKVGNNGELTTVSLPNSETRISVKGYILRRVQVMKQSQIQASTAQRQENKRAKKAGRAPKRITPKHSPTILFDTLFRETGVTKADLKTDTRKYVCDVLDFLKAKGQIKGYSQRKTGRAVTAIDIIL